MIELPVHDLYERLGNAISDEARVRMILEAFPASEGDALAEFAARAIRHSGGRISISRLAAAAGVTVRALGGAFERSIGITPEKRWRA